MFRKISLVVAFVFAAFSLVASPTMAAVTFDSATGTGFVGKGDIQVLYGWNNGALQQNASGVTFTYEATSSYQSVCTFTTGEGTKGEKTHNVEHKTRTSVADQVTYDARTMKQITGFTLLGFDTTATVGDEAPVVGGPCMGNEGHDGTWSSVTFVGSTGGLFVQHGGVSYPLPNTPVVIG